jgi:hypothetical protein
MPAFAPRFLSCTAADFGAMQQPRDGFRNSEPPQLCFTFRCTQNQDLPRDPSRNYLVEKS